MPVGHPSASAYPITPQITEQVSALAQGLDAAEKGVSFLKGRVKELEARPSATDQVRGREGGSARLGWP
jgi:hypothetical protein